jgi:hypothetical protein
MRPTSRRAFLGHVGRGALFAAAGSAAFAGFAIPPVRHDDEDRITFGALEP